MKKVLILLFLVGFKTISVGGDIITSEDHISNYYTLIYNSERDKEIKRRISIIKAIEWVESRHNQFAHNFTEDARGVFQIRKVMIDEINGLGYSYTHDDAWDYDKSVSMFVKYQNRFNPDWDPELAARKWNGGREGEKKPSTEQYWRRVEQRIDELMCCVD
ncbi:MAG: hypothetical protein M0R03_21775 [Novosphingobium sp.]|nr:hypothetical protein [Novosphingobium sp.]